MSANAFWFDESASGARLDAFGLSDETIHDCVRPAWMHARGRSSLAAPSTPGSDLYSDITEYLAVTLTGRGWERKLVNGQQRIIHPEGLLAIAVSAAVNVNNSHPKKHPSTRRKGPATLGDLDAGVIPGQEAFKIEGFDGDEAFEQRMRKAPLWLLLHEEIEGELRLSLARPALRDKQGRIIGFSHEIPIETLKLDTDLDIFRNDDDDEGGGIDFDVPAIR